MHAISRIRLRLELLQKRVRLTEHKPVFDWQNNRGNFQSCHEIYRQRLKIDTKRRLIASVSRQPGVRRHALMRVPRRLLRLSFDTERETVRHVGGPEWRLWRNNVVTWRNGRGRIQLHGRRACAGLARRAAVVHGDWPNRRPSMNAAASAIDDEAVFTAVNSRARLRWIEVPLRLADWR